MSVLVIIIAFSMLIIIHELAHLITAKLCGISVLDFSIGIGKPSFNLFKCKRIQFKFSPWLLGGYVRFADEKSDMPMSEADKKLGYKYFEDSNVLKRILVVLAGPLSNLLLALFLFYAATTFIGQPYIKPVIADGGIYKQLHKGDMIKEIKLSDSDKTYSIKKWRDLGNVLTLKTDKKFINMRVKVKRADEMKNIKLKAYNAERDKFNVFEGNYDHIYVLKDVKPDTGFTGIDRSDLLGGFIDSVKLTGYFTYGTVKGIYYIASGTLSTDNMAGPVKIVAMSNKAFHAGVFTFFVFMGLISLSLAVFNLLPLPVLDGGHILFFGIEAVKGTPVNERIMQISYKIGMFLLMTLFVYVVLQDILQVFFNN